MMDSEGDQKGNIPNLDKLLETNRRLEDDSTSQEVGSDADLKSGEKYANGAGYSGVQSKLDVMVPTEEPFQVKEMFGALCLEHNKNNISPQTQLVIENETNQDFHGLKDACKKMCTDLKNVQHRQILVNAQAGLDLDALLSQEVTDQIRERSTIDAVNWGSVLSILFVFLQIANRVIKERPLKSHLHIIVKNLTTVLRGKTSLWINKQGGWKEYGGLDHKPPSVKSFADLYLEQGEPFLVMIYEVPSRNVSSTTEKLVREVTEGFTKNPEMPCIHMCGSPDFPNPVDEVKFYTAHRHAIPVMYLTPAALKNTTTKQCYEAALGSANRHIIVPVELQGVKYREMLPALKEYEALKAFPKTTWKASEVRDFVGLLKGHLEKVIEQEIKEQLTAKTEGQAEIQLQIAIQTRKISDHDRKMVTNTIRSHTKYILEDPWTTLRQHLLHMYRIKNIRVDKDPDTDYLVLEIMTNNPDDIEKLISNCSTGTFKGIFPDHIKMPEVKDPYTFNVHMDEKAAKVIVQDLKLKNERLAAQKLFGATAADTDNSKAQILGGILKKMVDSDRKYDVYDLYFKLHQQRDSIVIGEATDMGRNLLHMIVASSRADCFRAVFYMNLWDELRLQMIDPQRDSQYGGYTARGLAEKYLFKSKGPKTLEEYDHYDCLWLKMPLLHKACLAGNYTYMRALLEKNTDINVLDQSGAPCVLYACASGSTKMVNFLIDHNADPKIENSLGENGLFLATMFGKGAMVKALLQRFDFPKEKVDGRKNRAIDYAAMNGDLDTLTAFSSNSVSPDDKLVALAAKYKRKPMVEVLVRHHSLSVRGRDDDNRTPFLNSAAKGDIGTMQYLLEHEYDNDASDLPSILLDRDRQNRNALHMVAEFGHSEASRFLIAEAKKRNCLPGLMNDRDFYTGRERLTIVRGRDRGRKAWHYLSIKRTLAYSFKKKMTSGQIDVKHFGEILGSGFGQNPSQKFMDDTEKDLEKQLKERFVDMTPLTMAAYKDHREVVLHLLEEGAGVATLDHFHCTTLHYVAMRGDLELAQRLEKQNADVAAMNTDKKTPADIAEENEHVNLVNFIRGKELYKHAAIFIQRMEETKKQLSEQHLGDLRSGGKDIRRHLIATLRDLTIEINKVLLNLGSGPVQEESLDSRSQQSDGSTAFAGVRPEHAPFPTIVSTVGGGGSNPDDWRRTSGMSSPEPETAPYGQYPYGRPTYGFTK